MGQRESSKSELWRLKQKDFYEFETSMGDIVNSRPTWIL